ncbi:type II toxin-antitoxin system death-on-curing family toxin [Enterococcus lemanii]|uniref:Type II toxin-antitoxin system death-on-curing family toxin n=1 Tax=Enterococcus lemanii TaxID=1159752 RepID=A0ABV9MX70_9ENTE|nr:type II toxin-antitoxin system death-on-curing family toxin [Enterococcus lemanii]MBM7708814.1 death-on-curing family protein [Enterococcus lemanii]
MEKKFYPSIYDKAASLLINIVKKNPFANANKRTGFMSAHVFLKINGYELNADQESSEQLTVKVETFIGNFEVLKPEVTHFFEKYFNLQE